MTREEAIEELKKMYASSVMIFGTKNDKETQEALKKAIDALKEQRPHGEWYYSYKNGWHCSICQQIVKDMPTVMGKANFDYCPNCGADMRKRGEEE